MATISNTELATQLAIQSSGYGAAAVSGAADPSSLLELLPNPWSLPASPTDGWSCEGSPWSLVEVVFQADARVRIDYLVINPATAPLTGNYVLELDGSSATYDATSSAPADVDALLAGWAAAIDAVFGVGGSGPDLLQSAEVVSVRRNGTDDAIRITALDPDDGTRGTYAIEADTLAPQAADLVVIREVAGATAAIRGLPDRTADAATDNLATLGARQTAWPLIADGNIGALDGNGWADAAATGGISRLFVTLTDPDYGDDTIADVAADPGVTVLDIAFVRVAPARVP